MILHVCQLLSIIEYCLQFTKEKNDAQVTIIDQMIALLRHSDQLHYC